ncbi:MAG TPA: alpha/beta fold hydrolase [Acidimicrobiales bacterium]|nr:alpha/beta fold hydrolase [Acidimicrobiales bacterium]
MHRRDRSTDAGDGRASLGRWRGERARRRYAAAQATVAERAWAELAAHGRPRPPDEMTIPTPYGPTHAYRWPGDGPPLVLLHGAGTSSLMWVPLVAGLPAREVVAVDVVGEPGRSTQTAPITTADDLAGWCVATLDGLGVARGHLVGASYGGYLAFRTAQRAPERVAAACLVEPVLDPLRPGFWRVGLQAGVALALPRRFGDPRLRRLGLGVLADHPDARTVALLGQTRFRRGLPRPSSVSDAEIADLAVPLCVVLGADSPIHDAGRLAARIRRARPDAVVEVLAGTGHTVPVDAADRVAPCVAAFLDGLAAGGEGPAVRSAP